MRTGRTAGGGFDQIQIFASLFSLEILMRWRKTHSSNFVPNRSYVFYYLFENYPTKIFYDASKWLEIAAKSKIWLNAFGYEMYCQFIFTVKMHQSIYKASTHCIMQFPLKIDIIVWSLSLSSTFFYQLWNVRKCITSLGIYLKQFHKENIWLIRTDVYFMLHSL